MFPVWEQRRTLLYLKNQDACTEKWMQQIKQTYILKNNNNCLDISSQSLSYLHTAHAQQNLISILHQLWFWLPGEKLSVCSLHQIQIQKTYYFLKWGENQYNHKKNIYLLGIFATKILFFLGSCDILERYIYKVYCLLWESQKSETFAYKFTVVFQYLL